jgi:hypothetical protein
MYVRAVEKQRVEVNKQIQALSADQTDPAAALPLLMPPAPSPAATTTATPASPG